MRAVIAVALALTLTACIERRDYQVADVDVDAAVETDRKSVV